jgi:hypothetical protein
MDTLHLPGSDAVCLYLPRSPYKLYEGRRKWYNHIWQAHRSALVTYGVHDCSICRKASLSTTIFQRHVGQHSEELALFSLPRTGSDENEFSVFNEMASEGQGLGSAMVRSWYCCGCKFGPFNPDLYDSCINCGKSLCSTCPYELI